MKKLKTEWIFWSTIYVINVIFIVLITGFVMFNGREIYFTSYNNLMASKIFWILAYGYGYVVLPITAAILWLHAWAKKIKYRNDIMLHAKMIIVLLSGLILIELFYKLLFFVLGIIHFLPYELVYYYFWDLSDAALIIIFASIAIIILSIPFVLIKKIKP